MSHDGHFWMRLRSEAEPGCDKKIYTPHAHWKDEEEDKKEEEEKISFVTSEANYVTERVRTMLKFSRRSYKKVAHHNLLKNGRNLKRSIRF
jgi:hypothetical protein